MPRKPTVTITNPNPSASRLPSQRGSFRVGPPTPEPITPKQITKGQANRLGGRAQATDGRKSL